MAKRRRGRRGRRYPHHLKKYMFKKRGRGGKRRRRAAKRRHRRTHHRRHHVARRRRHHRRRHHRRSRRGGGRGLLPGNEDIKLFAAGAAIGVLETKAKADANFPLNKIPRPVTALGYTGGTALALYAVSKFVGGKIGSYARLGARAAAVAAAYQLGKQGAAFTSVAIQGFDDDNFLSGAEEAIIQDHMMGALNAEGEMAGIPYDDAVEEAEIRE